MDGYAQYETEDDRVKRNYGISPAQPEQVQGSGIAGLGLAAASSGGNPAIMAGMVGLKALESYKKRKELEQQERYQAQVNVNNRTSNALSQLSNIGKALKL